MVPLGKLIIYMSVLMHLWIYTIQSLSLFLLGSLFHNPYICVCINIFVHIMSMFAVIFLSNLYKKNPS